MKKTIFILLILFAFAAISNAQEDKISHKFGAGFQLSQYQSDFGIGVNLTSPYFVHNSIAVRLRGNFMFYQHVKDGETTWSPYSNISLGVLGVGGMVGEFIRLYGEGGVILLIPSDEFSAESTVLGGYGVFGFEFYMSHGFNYFIELGGVGTGASADKIPTSPIYSNGFLISTGFRFHFK